MVSDGGTAALRLLPPTEGSLRGSKGLAAPLKSPLETRRDIRPLATQPRESWRAAALGSLLEMRRGSRPLATYPPEMGVDELPLAGHIAADGPET